MTVNGDREQEVSGTPWWVYAIYRVGVPAALSIFLVWFVTRGISADLNAMREEHQDMRFYLQGICINTAPDIERARERCILPSPPPR